MTRTRLPMRARSLLSRRKEMKDMETTTEKTTVKNGHAKTSDVLEKTDRGLVAPLAALKIQKGFNVRGDAAPSAELVASVKESGVQNPIHVRDGSEPGTFYVIDGERRYNAAHKAKVDSVLVVYHGNMSDAEAIVLSLTANENQKSLSEGERAEGFKRLKEFTDETEIARLMGVSVRTVKETLRALDKGVKEIKEGVKKSPEKGGIPTRVAARAADLPAKIQKQVAKKVKGKSTKEGLRVVQKAEKELGKVQRGRQPTLPLARDAKRRVDQIEELIIDRLKSSSGQTKARLLAHYEMVLMMRGDREVKDVYLPDGKMSAMPATVKKSVNVKTQKASAKKASAKKAPGKTKLKKLKVKSRTAAKKATANKKPAKSARKGAR
jgi:ParB/RepB/Spo0J family partition protein